MAIDLRMDGEDVIAVLSLTDKETLKPDLLVRAITGDAPENMRIHRIALLGRDKEGELKPLMNTL